MKPRTLILVFIALCWYTSIVVAQQLAIELAGGISKDMRSQTSNRWNTGFALSGSLFAGVVDWLSVGGRIGYHSRGIDGEGWAEDMYSGFSGSYTVRDAKGTQTLIEVLPALRFHLSRDQAPTMVYFQAGAGFFLVSESDIEITTSYQSTNVTGQETVSYSDNTLTGIGVQLALPFVISRTISLYPLYSLYLGGGDLYHFYALQLGFSIAGR
jgi:hypothetical protein